MSFWKKNVIRFLLEEGADPDLEDDEGQSPGSIILMDRELRRRFPDATAPGMEDVIEGLSFTELHASAARIPGHDSLSPALLEREFRDLNSRDRLGMTPLHWACSRGDTTAVELLLR